MLHPCPGFRIFSHSYCVDSPSHWFHARTPAPLRWDPRFPPRSDRGGTQRLARRGSRDLSARHRARSARGPGRPPLVGVPRTRDWCLCRIRRASPRGDARCSDAACHHRGDGSWRRTFDTCFTRSRAPSPGCAPGFPAPTRSTRWSTSLYSTYALMPAEKLSSARMVTGQLAMQRTGSAAASLECGWPSALPVSLRASSSRSSHCLSWMTLDALRSKREVPSGTARRARRRCRADRLPAAGPIGGADRVHGRACAPLRRHPRSRTCLNSCSLHRVPCCSPRLITPLLTAPCHSRSSKPLRTSRFVQALGALDAR